MKKRNYWNRLVAYLYRRQTKVHTWSYKEELRAYIKKRKKRKRRLLGIMIVVVIGYLSSCGMNEARQALYPYKYLYKDDWEIYSVYVDDEENEISISLGDKTSSAWNRVRSVYDVVMTAFYDEGLGKWQDYEIKMYFGYSETYFHIINDSSKQSLVIRINADYKLPVEKAAEYFPETKCLDVNEVDEYSDLSGFDDLEYLQVNEIDEEEQEYVWSLFPECIIEDWQGNVYYNHALEE